MHIFEKLILEREEGGERERNMETKDEIHNLGELGQH